jgi:hypothetical protein
VKTWPNDRSLLRYAFYLRPCAAMARAQVELHDLLRHQYGLRAAGRFMPHVTLKGFFRSTAPVETLTARLDGMLAGIHAFPVFNHGVRPFRREAVFLDVHGLRGGEPNLQLQQLHDAALDTLLPLVDPACEFTGREWLGERFHAHLTLAMADLPSWLFTEVLAFVQETEPIGPDRFLATTVQLVAFASDDWADQWWPSLRWQLLHSWQLPSANTPSKDTGT